MDKFERVPLDIQRTFSLATLLNECDKNDVGVKEIFCYQNGFQVLFDGVNGDAILHDGSYGRNSLMWETYHFPWDYDDVSVHDAKTLAKMIGALQRGEDWEKIEKEEA